MADFDWSKLLQPAGNYLTDLGAGLGGTTNLTDAFAAANGRYAQQQPQRQAAQVEAEKYAQQQSALKQQEQQVNATAQWLASQGKTDLATMVQNRQMTGGDALRLMYSQAAQGPASPDTKVINDKLVDTSTGKIIGDYGEPASPTDNLPKAPAGYRYLPNGASLEPIPGGPAGNGPKPTEQQLRNQSLYSVVKPDVDSLLGDPATGKKGTFDSLSNWVSQSVEAAGPLGMVIGGGPNADFKEAKNALNTIAQSYLYSVSGQAAPAEEVKKIVDSVTPQFGEPKPSVDEKKKRLARYVEAIKLAGGKAGLGTVTTPTAYTILGVE